MAINPADYTIVPEVATRGTTIGRQREIAPVEINPTSYAERAAIAPIERVYAPNLGYAVGTQSAQLNPWGDKEFRDKQIALAQALQARANGEGPSLARLQVNENFDKIIANQRGAVAASRGNPALAMRLAANQGGELQQSAAREGLRAALEERYAAEQQLGQVASEGRQVDTQRDSANAQLEQQANALTSDATNQRGVQQGELNFRGTLANAQAENARAAQQGSFDQTTNTYNATADNSRSLQQAQLITDAIQRNQSAVNDRNVQNANISGGIQQSTLAANAQKEAAAKAAAAAVQSADIRAQADIYGYSLNALVNSGNSQGSLGAQGQQINSTAQNNDNNNNTATTGAIVNGASSSYETVYSDERLKKDVSDGEDKTAKFLDALKSRNFKYKDPHKHGEGDYTGVMAQDMEKSELGNDMVVDTPEGKTIDLKRGLMGVLAAQAELNKRLKQIEGKKK